MQCALTQTARLFTIPLANIINMNKIIALLIVLISSSFTIVNAQHNDHLKDSLGKIITLTGIAANTKLGALLIMNDSTSIWIDGKESWPRGYSLGGGNGKTLEVTGFVIEKYDLPVFISKEDESTRSGIPVPEGTDLKKASHRYLLKNAKWKIRTE